MFINDFNKEEVKLTNQISAFTLTLYKFPLT